MFPSNENIYHKVKETTLKRVVINIDEEDLDRLINMVEGLDNIVGITNGDKRVLEILKRHR